MRPALWVSGPLPLIITDFEQVVSSCPCVVSSFFFLFTDLPKEIGNLAKDGIRAGMGSSSAREVILIANCPDIGLL